MHMHGYFLYSGFHLESGFHDVTRPLDQAQPGPFSQERKKPKNEFKNLHSI